MSPSLVQGYKSSLSRDPQRLPRLQRLPCRHSVRLPQRVDRYAVALGEPRERVAPADRVRPRALLGIGAAAGPPGAAVRPGCCRWRSACSTTADPVGSRRIRPRSRRASRPSGRDDSRRCWSPRPAWDPTCGAPWWSRSRRRSAPPAAGRHASRRGFTRGFAVLEQPAAHPVLPGDAAHRLTAANEVLDERHPLLRGQLRVRGDRHRAPPGGQTHHRRGRRRRRQTEDTADSARGSPRRSCPPAGR